jgi:HK97 family phage portal protein
MLLKPSNVFALQETARERADRNARGPREMRHVSYSDEVITPESAVTTSAVIAIMTLLSQDTASLPLLLYARRGRNKFRATDNPYYELMHDQPNPEMSSMIFRELIVSHLLAWGNFYGQLIWDEAGIVREIWPLRPDRMLVERIEGMKVYTYRSADGKPRVFTADEILHVPGWGFDGMVGQSRIAMARNAIGLAISAEKFGSKLFANDARPGVVYQHPSQLSDTAFKHLQESLLENKGAANAWKPKILEEGMTIKEIGIPPEDAQFLQTRQFQLSEINRILGPVPPHMIGDVQKSTSWGTGIDSQEQGYVNHTLRPLAVRIEQALNSQLLLKSDREQGYFYEHLFDGLLRGDIATRYEAYVKAINNGVMSRNEVRERENLNPRNGLDDMLMPLNMVTVGTTQQPQNSLRPLIHDAALRVARREANDVRGAARRHLSKGQDAEFTAWVSDFYANDHSQFIRKQFAPVIEAFCTLFGAGDLSDEFGEYFENYAIKQAGQFGLLDAGFVELQCDALLEKMPDELTEGISRILNGASHER